MKCVPFSQCFQDFSLSLFFRNLWYGWVWFSMFILFEILWASWICGFIIKHGRYSATVLHICFPQPPTPLHFSWPPITCMSNYLVIFHFTDFFTSDYFLSFIYFPFLPSPGLPVFSFFSHCTSVWIVIIALTSSLLIFYLPVLNTLLR